MLQILSYPFSWKCSCWIWLFDKWGDFRLQDEGNFICYRTIVYDGIQNEEGFLKVGINKKLLSYVQETHAEYLHALEENKKMWMTGKKQKQEWCRFDNQLKNLKRAKTIYDCSWKRNEQTWLENPCIGKEAPKCKITLAMLIMFIGYCFS